MSYKSLKFHIKGTAPLIVHNARMTDPLDKWTIALAKLTTKRKKTVEDHEEISRIEWCGGLYLSEHDSGVPVIPSANIERLFRDAAMKQRKGKDVQSGMICTSGAPIIYSGPKDSDAMWNDKAKRFACRASVGLRGVRLIRTRPIFPEWELKFEIEHDPSILDESSVHEFLEYAGRYIGLGDWRPKHGRFEVM